MMGRARRWEVFSAIVSATPSVSVWSSLCPFTNGIRQIAGMLRSSWLARGAADIGECPTVWGAQRTPMKGHYWPDAVIRRPQVPKLTTKVRFPSPVPSLQALTLGFWLRSLVLAVGRFGRVDSGYGKYRRMSSSCIPRVAAIARSAMCSASTRKSAE